MIYDLLIVYVPKFALNMADNLGIYSTILYIYIYGWSPFPPRNLIWLKDLILKGAYSKMKGKEVSGGWVLFSLKGIGQQSPRTEIKSSSWCHEAIELPSYSMRVVGPLCMEKKPTIWSFGVFTPWNQHSTTKCFENNGVLENCITSQHLCTVASECSRVASPSSCKVHTAIFGLEASAYRRKLACLPGASPLMGAAVMGDKAWETEGFF